MSPPLLLLLPLVLACADDAGDAGTSEGLPPGDAGSDSGDDDGSGSGDVGTTDTGFVPGDGAGGPEEGDDDAPAHTLTLVQGGTWTMSPFGGPYETVAGTLTVTEYLDGGAPDEEGRGGGTPQCTATFALTGFAEDVDCDGCAVAFSVNHQLTVDGGTVEGSGEGGGDTGAVEEIPGLSGCLAPDLPADGDDWILALSADGATISKRTGAGGWLPWYDAETRYEDVTFSWTATVGIELDDEEEE